METTQDRGRKSLARALFLCCAGIAAVAVAAPCLAQSSPQGLDLRYDTLLKRQERNRTTPGNEFGDQHGIESGSLTFNIVDVDIPGNNKLAVEFRRSLTITDPKKNLNAYAYGYPSTRLGDWAFGVPKIEATYDAAEGWITSDPGRRTKNCSLAQPSYMEPPDHRQYPEAFRAHMFWNPPTITFPDGGSGLLVYRSTYPVPTSGGPYYWVTTSNDAVSCIATIKNRPSSSSAPAKERLYSQGEGYLVTRQDGTRYWFDWMALESEIPTVSSAFSSYGPPMEVQMYQATLALYPTRVEDRFGNSVTYTYSNKANEAVKLDRIESSDGRIITLAYTNGELTSVSAHGRTWTYIYAAPAGSGIGTFLPNRLAEVRLPDSTSWRYAGDSHPFPAPRVTRPCDNLSWTQTVNSDATTVGDTDFTGFTVDSPSGARAVFRIGTAMLGRSAVTDGCYAPGVQPAGQTPNRVPRRFLGGYRHVLTGKKVTGPGLSPAIWKYSYQSNIGFAPMANGTTRTKILGPDGALDTYTFGNTYGVDEGLLLSHTRANGTQAPLMSEVHTYATGTPAPVFPMIIGFHPDARDRTPAVFLRPKLSTTKVMQGTRFMWEVEKGCDASGVPCLDTFGRPTRIKRSSSAAP